jgi:DNA recombination protein RmuC
MAILCVGTEGLYAEVHREPGFVDELRSQFQIIVAGPTTLMAILSSLQMGFKALAIQNKSSEVRNLLAKTKTEFGKFGVLMNSVETQVGTVQNTLQKVGVRTRAINKTLSEVEVIEMGPTKAIPLFDPNMEVEEESEDRPTNISDSVTVDFEEDLD